jgi:hypothetical protein
MNFIVKTTRIISGLLMMAVLFNESVYGKKPLPMKYKWAMVQLNDSILVMETELIVQAWLSYYSWHLKNKKMQKASGIPLV